MLKNFLFFFKWFARVRISTDDFFFFFFFDVAVTPKKNGTSALFILFFMNVWRLLFHPLFFFFLVVLFALLSNGRSTSLRTELLCLKNSLYLPRFKQALQRLPC